MIIDRFSKLKAYFLDRIFRATTGELFFIFVFLLILPDLWW